MRLHAVHLPSGIYVTRSPTLASDFRAWGYRVDAYVSHHHNVLALLAMQRAEGFDQHARESELMDTWCAESIGRWGFECRVGALLSERESSGWGGPGEDLWDLGAALGLGRDNFTEDARAVKVGRRRGSWGGLGGVRAWFEGIVGRRNVDEVGEVDGGDAELLPMYTKGEDPPAYER